jgi:hypothetical protein
LLFWFILFIIPLFLFFFLFFFSFFVSVQNYKTIYLIASHTKYLLANGKEYCLLILFLVVKRPFKFHFSYISKTTERNAKLFTKLINYYYYYYYYYYILIFITHIRENLIRLPSIPSSTCFVSLLKKQKKMQINQNKN